MNPLTRCSWARTPLGIAYHDAEWGVPVHDDRTLFEFLTLEGAQAGLSWETILKKRETYRDAFLDFDPARVARFTPARVERLLQNAGIVRNRLKIESTIVTRAHSSLFRRSSAASMPTSGASLRERRWKTVDVRRMRFLPVQRIQTRSAVICCAEDSSSSARRSVMPSCRRSDWSTITLPTVSVMRSLDRMHVMSRRFYIVDVFAERPYAANQFAVVVDAADLSSEAMHRSRWRRPSLVLLRARMADGLREVSVGGRVIPTVLGELLLIALVELIYRTER